MFHGPTISAICGGATHWPKCSPEFPAPENQREFKLSYNVNPAQMPSIRQLYRHLHEHKLRASLIFSHQEFLDVLPVRASKGHAIRFLAYKWGLPLKNFLA